MAGREVSALEKAMRLLALRAFSEKELTERLLRAGFPEADVSAAVTECCRRRFIDDAMLASDCVESLRQRNQSSRQIRVKLIKRGLAGEIVDGLPESDSDDAEIGAARRALELKWRLLARESDPRKKREKAFRFMIGRGFGTSLVIRLLSEIGADDDGDSDFQ